LIAWAVQVPIAIATPLKQSVVYLVFLSLAALIESAGTDYDQARQDEKKEAHGDRTQHPDDQDG
jgi:hypothetical protein